MEAYAVDENVTVQENVQQVRVIFLERYYMIVAMARLPGVECCIGWKY